MFATRWRPLVDLRGELNRLQGEMARVFGRPGWAENGVAEYPAINLWEENDTYFAEMELPGMELGDLEIYVNGGNQLTLKGERKPPVVEGGNWHRQERGYGTFVRTVALPTTIDSEKVKANLKHGVLTVSLPKHEEVKPRRIEVKTD